MNTRIICGSLLWLVASILAVNALLGRQRRVSSLIVLVHARLGRQRHAAVVAGVLGFVLVLEGNATRAVRGGCGLIAGVGLVVAADADGVFDLVDDIRHCVACNSVSVDVEM